MISVVVPIYNAERYLDECLESIAAQSYKDIEVLCVDDGSKDNSLSICNKWAKCDRRFRVLSQPNQGVSAARNTALDNAHGEYICFVDSDDVLFPDYLSHLIEISNDGSFPVCGYTKEKNRLGRKIEGRKCYDAREYILAIVYESIIHPNLWMMLFKAKIIQDNNLRFYVGCVRNEDTEFFVHYLLYEEKVVVTNNQYYYYRQNPDSVMNKPITINSFTSIEASLRMDNLLIRDGVIDDAIIKSNGVLTYAFALSKRHDKKLYLILHENYNVKEAMKRMLTFPRASKRLVALIYIMFGQNIFYSVIGNLRIIK